MFFFEKEAWDKQFKFVAGVDEAGRGPLAGPVVAAAMIIPKGIDFPLVNDSKKLTDKQRRKLSAQITSIDNLDYSIVEISEQEVDNINILNATHMAMKKAILNLRNVDFALIDGLPVPNFPIDCKSIVKGDSKSASIAAASILAKVYRDDLMIDFSIKYPQYGFEKHKGYGTAQHIKAIKEFGPCPIHRRTFAPISMLYPINIPDTVQHELNLF